MTYSEARRWMLYRIKRGGFNQSLRVEKAAALLASLYSQVHSKSPPSIYDFMPHEEEPEITLDEAMRSW